MGRELWAQAGGNINDTELCSDDQEGNGNYYTAQSGDTVHTNTFQLVVSEAMAAGIRIVVDGHGGYIQTIAGNSLSVIPTAAVVPASNVKLNEPRWTGATGADLGSLAAGGYTYGDEDPSQVLTTADGAGTLDLSLYTLITGVVAAADVRSGTPRYTGGANGSLAVPAANKVLSPEPVDATTGTLTLPAASAVWYGSGAYGVGGTGSTPSKRASSITNCEAGNVKDGVTIDNVTGTLLVGAGLAPDPSPNTVGGSSRSGVLAGKA